MCFTSVNGRLALAVARNAGIEVIDPDDGTTLRVIAPDRTAGAIKALGDLLIAGGADGVVDRYDPASGMQSLRRAIGPGSIKDLEVYGPESAPLVAAVLDSGLHVWRTFDGVVTRMPDPPDLDSTRMFKTCAYEWGGHTWLTCAYTDGHLATWDADDPDAAPIAQRAHDGPIWSLISADGDGSGPIDPIVITGGSDRRVRVWAPEGGGRLAQRTRFVADGTIRRLGHVTDGTTTMLVSASATGAVALWRLDGSPDRPELEISRHFGEAWALACGNTADGVLIASGDMNGAITIKRLSTALLTEASVRPLFHAGTTLWALAHGDTADGPYAAAAGVDQTVTLIDPSGRREPMRLREHSSTVRALAAGGNRGRSHLISGGADHRVLDWDPRSGELRGELPMGHQGEVWALAVYARAGAAHVISGSADGSVRMLALDDAGAPSAVRVLATDCGEVNSVFVVDSDDDELVVIGSGRGLTAVSLRTGAGRTLSLPGVSTACAVADADRPLAVVARQDGVVQLIDPIAGATVSTFAHAYGSGQVRALAPVEVAGTTFVLGGCDDGRILVWHIDGTLVSNPVRAGTAGIRAMNVVDIAPPRGGRQSALITAGHDGVVRLWPVTMDSPLRSGGSVGRDVRPASILLQDQPTGRDQLARDPLVETLYAALTSANTKPPVVVGVHAPWGQGKSSLLRQLRERIDPRPGEDDDASADASPTHGLFLPSGSRARTRLTRAWAWRQVQRSGDHDVPLSYEMKPLAPDRNRAITVWFNPWMYERTDQIWAGLTREILIAVTERMDKAERERLWFDLNLRRTDPSSMRKRILSSYIPRTLAGLLLSVVLVFCLAVAAVAMGVAAVNSPTVTAWLGPTTLVMLTVLGTIAQLTSGSLKHVRGWVAPDELNSTAGPEHAWKGTPDPLTSTDRGYLYMLQHDVGEVVALATKHAPLYVFIDDLDRCGPAIVADTIEAINLFLNKAFGQCVFVVALDPATVAAHLETAFRDVNRRATEDPMSFGHLRHTGWRFMEKIIDLPIRLPRVPDAALSNYLDRLLESAPRKPTPVVVPGRPPRQRLPRLRGRGNAASGGTVAAGDGDLSASDGALSAGDGSRVAVGGSRAGGGDAEGDGGRAGSARAHSDGAQAEGDRLLGGDGVSGGSVTGADDEMIGASVPRARAADDETLADASTAAASGAASTEPPVTTVELVIVPDRPTTASSVAVVGELEALPPVRDALRAAVLSLPGRNPRQTKAFVNLWRFYMVLDHRMGLFSPSLLAIERHSIEMARLVELMVRWPYLLDPLGEQAFGGADAATHLDRLMEACDADDELWASTARRARLDHQDIAVQGLRDLLRRARPNGEVFTEIARRYL